MEPTHFHTDKGLPVIIMPEKAKQGTGSCSFHLYYGDPGNLERCLSDLNNYVGLIYFDRSSRRFSYTPGNRAVTSEEILQAIDYIKSNIF